MIDDPIAAGAAEQGADGKAMHHAGGVVDLPDRIGGLDGLSRIVEIEEAASRVDDAGLEKVEKVVGLREQPFPVKAVGAPAWAKRWENGLEVRHRDIHCDRARAAMKCSTSAQDGGFAPLRVQTMAAAAAAKSRAAVTCSSVSAATP